MNLKQKKIIFWSVGITVFIVFLFIDPFISIGFIPVLFFTIYRLIFGKFKEIYEERGGFLNHLSGIEEPILISLFISTFIFFGVILELLFVNFIFFLESVFYNSTNDSIQRIYDVLFTPIVFFILPPLLTYSLIKYYIFDEIWVKTFKKEDNIIENDYPIEKNKFLTETIFWSVFFSLLVIFSSIIFINFNHLIPQTTKHIFNPGTMMGWVLPIENKISTPIMFSFFLLLIPSVIFYRIIFGKIKVSKFGKSNRTIVYLLLGFTIIYLIRYFFMIINLDNLIFIVLNLFLKSPDILKNILIIIFLFIILKKLMKYVFEKPVKKEEI
jgi:hypothetical protein